jgi:hypothetical protein
MVDAFLRNFLNRDGEVAGLRDQDSLFTLLCHRQIVLPL